jgi:hypothetical protein
MFARLMIATALAAAALTPWPTPTRAQTITVATNPQGSVGHAIGLGVAVVISKRTDVVARPVALGGGTAFLPQINEGTIELGTNNIIDNNFAVRGHATFDGKANPNLRAVARLVDFYAGLMVRVDSDIKSPKDFKGRPFPTEFTQQSIVKFTTEAMLATGGVGWDDIKPVPVVNFAKGIELLAARRVDGANGAPGSAIIQEANSRTPIKFIPIERSPANQAIMDRIVPGAAFADLDPAPYMPEIRETVTMLGFPFMLVTGTHVSDEIIYKITKALYEAKADLIAQHGVFRSFDPKKMAVDAADLKYHPGAVKFYAENGLWPPAKH